MLNQLRRRDTKATRMKNFHKNRESQIITVLTVGQRKEPYYMVLLHWGVYKMGQYILGQALSYWRDT